MRFKFNISTKLWVGFGFLLGTLVIMGAISYSIIVSAHQTNNKLETVTIPSLLLLGEIKTDITKSQELIVSWLTNYNEDIPQKNNLSSIHNESYPLNTKKLKRVAQQWAAEEIVVLDSVLVIVDSVIRAQHVVMIRFDEAESYTTEFAKENLSSLINSYTTGARYEQTEYALGQINKVIRLKEKEYDRLSASMDVSFVKLQSLISVVGALLVFVGLIIAFLVVQSIVKPIRTLKELLVVMSKGVLPNLSYQKRKDELGDINNTLVNLIEGLKSIVSFSKSIGDGGFETKFRPLSKDDDLGNNLLLMRDNLKQVSEEDRKRNWTTGGLAKFNELLREKSDNVHNLTEHLISELVEYLGANQGGIFVLEDTEDEPYMSLISCYAWDRRKFLDEKVFSGEGLVGQSWLERDVFYITDVPEDYIKITSGLGKALPKSLLIIPMISNEKVYGVIEIASFKYFEEYEIEFVQRLAESTAGTIASARVNERTKYLLEQTQYNTNQLKKKEEEFVKNQLEMRQSHDMLGSEIKELRRKMKELENKNAILKEENETVRMLSFKLKKELDRQKNG